MWYCSAWKPISFYHPTKDRRLSQIRHCRKGLQAMPKAVYCSPGFCDKHTNCLWWDLHAFQSGILPLEHCNMQCIDALSVVEMFGWMVAGCAAIWRYHFRSVPWCWFTTAGLWSLPRSTEGQHCQEKAAACSMVYWQDHPSMLDRLLNQLLLQFCWACAQRCIVLQYKPVPHWHIHVTGWAKKPDCFWNLKLLYVIM